MYQLLEGQSAIHARRVIHRDLKPQNLLLSKDGSVLKIADFGLSRKLSLPKRPYTVEVCTLWYRSPEMLQTSGEYGTESDIWACGCIFAELISQKAMFCGDCNIDQLNQIFKIRGTPTEETWPGFTDILGKYNARFKIYEPQNLSDFFANHNIEENGIDLQGKLQTVNPELRISAKEALNHPYFQSI